MSPCHKKTCICEHKGAADQRLGFWYIFNIITLIPSSEISFLQPFSVADQPGLCRDWSESHEDSVSRDGFQLTFSLLFMKTRQSQILKYKVMCWLFYIVLLSAAMFRRESLTECWALLEACRVSSGKTSWGPNSMVYKKGKNRYIAILHRN